MIYIFMAWPPYQRTKDFWNRCSQIRGIILLIYLLGRDRTIDNINYLILLLISLEISISPKQTIISYSPQFKSL